MFSQQCLLFLTSLLLSLLTITFRFTFVATEDPNKRLNVNPANPPQSEDEESTYEQMDIIGLEGEEKAKYHQREKHKCTYFYNNRYPNAEGGLINCTWYTANSCCKRTEVTSVFSAMDPLYGATVLCRNYINYLMCFFCSPDQYKFYRANKKVSVCLDYCESLYEECKTAGFNKSLIGEAYGNGTAFCAAQNFEVVDSADCFKFDPKVFGSSNRLFPVLPVLLLFVSILLYTLC
uniref:Folate receptor-like domain-containing protein n=1 Tax=Biomphalaria glabrata TaxID=6526 RepID=A0A2C9LYG6_BIOGL